MSHLRSIILPATYRDSVFLLELSLQACRQSGVTRVSAMMATARNKELMARFGLLSPELAKTGADDLIVAIQGPFTKLDGAERLVRALLAEPVPPPDALAENSFLPLTLRQAKDIYPESNLALISVAGDYAHYEAAQALALGMDVLLYSDNISLEHEVLLKTMARSKGCIVMGPDCGTAVINNVPLGFANSLRPGLVGLIGATGTGLQEVCCLLDRCGLGISYAYGTGGRDLSAAVGAMSTLAALDRLERDPLTELVVVIAKYPSEDARKILTARYRRYGKPLIVRYLGVSEYAMEEQAGVSYAMTLTGLARQAAETLAPLLDTSSIDAPDLEAVAVAPGFLRGIYSGGALCFEALLIAHSYFSTPVFSNLAADGVEFMESYETSRQHSFIDMGDTFFTIGSPHPLVSPEKKLERIFTEMQDPAVSVVLTDIVLGNGTSPQQATLLIQTLDKAAQVTGGASRKKRVVASVCGTESDVPTRSSQVHILEQAGVFVAGNNVQAATWACRLLTEKGQNND